MKLSDLLIHYDNLTPRTRETFSAGVKLGLWGGWFITTIIAIIVYNLFN